MSITFAKLGQYGRLSNSLLEAAATIALALQNNDNYIFPYWKYMDDFNIPISKFIDPKLIKYTHTYEEPHYHYSPIPYRKSLNLHGYFQTFLYWGNKYNEILDLITPKLSKYNHKYLDEVISLHVRRTDYLTFQDCYVILDRNNYYDKAMDLLNAKKVLLFSDDMNWVKENFKGNMFEYSEGNSDVMDLHIMSRCLGGHIIANSSFSYVSAHLDRSENKRVIAPGEKLWFGSKLASSHNTKDLCPSDWYQI